MIPSPATTSGGGLPAGTRFGRYATIERLARGGMAELYLARNAEQPQLERMFVVKRILPHLAEDPEFVRMFLNEVAIASRLTHPNIAQVVDYGVERDEHFFVMEYVHGENVRSILAAASNGRRLPLGSALTIATGVAAGLHFAHEFRDRDGQTLEIVHRDVSPSNVMVTYDGAVKLLDFGIAKAMAHTRTTQAGTIKGKTGYMSPEQCRGEILDRRSDVFGLAVMAYELTTGRRLYYGTHDYAVMNKILSGKFDDPVDVVVGYPSQLRDIVVRGLSLEPKDRFATARELGGALERYAVQRGLVLSGSGLADYMHAAFGEPTHPIHDSRLMPLTVASSFTGDSEVTGPGTEAGFANRSRMIAVAAAAVVGVAGFLLGSWSRNSESRPQSSPPTAPATVAAPASPTVAPTDARDPESAAAVADSQGESADAIEPPQPAETPSASPDKRRRKTGRSRRSKQRSKKPAAPDKSADKSILPPSLRRSDRLYPSRNEP